MDLQGLEKALGRKLERDTRSGDEYGEAVVDEFRLQAERLRLLGEANHDGPTLRWGINVARLDESPYGRGTLSAFVTNVRSRFTNIHVDYYFTPQKSQGRHVAGHPMPVATERFSDEENGYSVLAHWNSPDYRMRMHVEEYMVSQTERMQETARMLEQAIATPDLGNEVVFDRYTELSVEA
jgi:hypothetical protein